MKSCLKQVSGCSAILGLLALPAFADSYSGEIPTDPFESIVDIREADSRLMLKKGDIVVVPIPISDPTLGTGLVLGGAYFYSQTEKQKAAQPASLTGAVGIYTHNDSYAYGVFQQNYWGGDTWRFNGGAGHLDFKLRLLDPENNDDKIDWSLRGNFLQVALSRRIHSDWYLGVMSRYVKISQGFDIDIDEIDFDVMAGLTSAGIGATLEFDSRDVPTNAFKGRRFEISALLNGEITGGDNRYQSYDARYRSYHQLADPLILAWEIRGCKRTAEVPLWDACRVNLRGFAATDYLSKSSLSGQVEARWQFWKKLGMVGFAGYGFSETNYSDAGGNERIPSYGVGLRYMVLGSKRINMRLDYARSIDSDAWYLAISEAF